MNPYTGETVPIDPKMFRKLDDARDHKAMRDIWGEERRRAADAVGLDDPDDLVLIQGDPEHVARISDAVKAHHRADTKARRRAANKRARTSRKRNRR